MLRPTKYSHPDRTVINVALIVLDRAKRLRIASYSDLLSLAKKSVGGGGLLFLPALNFLFLMGLIEYRPKTDSIEYVGRNDTI